MNCEAIHDTIIKNNKRTHRETIKDRKRKFSIHRT